MEPGANGSRVHRHLRPALWLLVFVAAGCATESPSPLVATTPTAQPILQDDAPPLDVLEVFLKTLVIGDCDATRELSTESGFLQVGGLCERIHVGNFVIVGDGTSPRPDQMVYVTTLTIDGAKDVLSEGDHTIFFSLGRQPSGAWRVTGGGTGP